MEKTGLNEAYNVQSWLEERKEIITVLLANKRKMINNNLQQLNLKGIGVHIDAIVFTVNYWIAQHESSEARPVMYTNVD